MTPMKLSGGLTLAGLALVLCVAGCAAKHDAPTTRPLTASERSDKALRDPFGYSPDFSETDRGAGGDAQLDHKGLRRDLGNVIMP